MILYNLKSLQGPNCNGKWYPTPVITQTIDLDGLSEHMANHNTPYSKGAIKGILTDMVSCIRELVLDGQAVKIPDLATFSIAIHSSGVMNKDDYDVNANIKSVRLKARAIGDFNSKKLKLEYKLKDASTLKALEATNKTTD